MRDLERRRRFSSAIAGMPELAIAVIKAAQPYRRGNKASIHVLYLLSRLENADKHRQHVPFAAGLDDTVATAKVRGKSIDLPMPNLPNAPTFVADGAVVAHFGYREQPNEPPLNEWEVTVQVSGTPLVAIRLIDENRRKGKLPGYMPLLNLLETLLRQVRDFFLP